MVSFFYQKLYQELIFKLEEIPQIGLSSHYVMAKRLEIIRDSIKSFENFIGAHSLLDQELILVQKKLFPELKALELLEIERYHFIKSIPTGDSKIKRKYFKQVLSGIERFFSRYDWAYEYFVLEAVELDELYFLKDEEITNTLVPLIDFCGDDPFTVMGYLFAKFICFDQLAKFVLKEMNALPNGKLLAETSNITGVQWTGETVNLIEIAYGVFLQGQIDNKVGVVEFFEQLGEFFGVKLGVPKRGFEDIRRRKRLSKTHFLDRAREGILKKIDQEDSL